MVSNKRPRYRRKIVGFLVMRVIYKRGSGIGILVRAAETFEHFKISRSMQASVIVLYIVVRSGRRILVNLQNLKIAICYQ